jgi:hypothetical protein
MTQESFSTLWTGFSSEVEAKKARDARYQELKKQGVKSRRWVLRDQIRQYWSFGNPCGESCNVYIISVQR